MSTEGLRNVRGGLILLPLGLLGGLALSLFAFVPLVAPPAGFEQYGDLPRRLMRLAHIAAVMLPLINVVVGRELDALALSPKVKRWASSALLWSAVGLPLALAAEALSPVLATLHVSGLPALTLTAALVTTAIGAARSVSRPTEGSQGLVRRASWRVIGRLASLGAASGTVRRPSLPPRVEP